MIHEGKRKRSGEAAIERIVAEYERSGLTRRGFSEQTGIAIGTLDSWRRQVRDRARIVPVRIEPDAAAGGRPGGGFELNLPNGVRIESGWDYPEQAMACLLRLLGQAAER